MKLCKKTLSLMGLLLMLTIVQGDYNHEPGMCMLQGSCGFNTGVDRPTVRGPMGCLNNTKALRVTSKDVDHFKKIQDVCPMLIDSSGDVADVCCLPAQLDTLLSQLTASVLLFERCPSCVENFYNFYCQLTCSPNQATFINVTDTLQNPGYAAPGVSEQSVYLSKEFADGLHASCKDVVFPQTNGKAITLVCNGFSGDDCTPQAFLNFLGSTNNGIAPVDMNFQQIGNDTGLNSVTQPEPPEGMDYLRSFNYKCSEAPNNQSEACSCTDCQTSCPLPPPLPEPVPPFMIGNYDGIGVIMFIVFCALVAIFLGYLLVSCMCTKSDKKESEYKVEKSQHTWSESSSDTGDNQNMDEPLIERKNISCFESWSKLSQDKFKQFFRWWGTLVARRPLWVIIPTLLVVIALSVGMKFILLTTDPIKLWTSESSRVRVEKDYYDAQFGAFYRTEMVIMTLKPEYQSSGSIYTSTSGIKHNFSEILDKKYILASLELQNKLRYMNVTYEDNEGNTKIGDITDICFKPLEPDNNNCTITSISGYWQNDPNVLNETTYYFDKLNEVNYSVDYREHFIYCVESPAAIQATTPLQQSCMGDYEGPVFPFLILGGQKEDEPYNRATGLIMTFVVQNFAKDDERTKIVMAWEKAFLETMKNWNSEYFDFTYFSERSMEDELIRSSESDLTVFVISYAVIFLYITIALGTYTSCRRIPVDSKVTLGVAGILVILGSVFASIGFFGYIGYETSLIVIEVVPFLVLAIGADNVFILTLEYQRDERLENESLEEQIGRVFGQVAPSMLLCSMTECVIFFLGALTNMPAVEQFAYAAAAAILIDFLLQITVFLAVLSLDAKRQEQNRIDCCCCFRVEQEDEPTTSYLQIFFEKYYAPFLMNDIVRMIVMIVFIGITCWCVVLTTNMEVGLDQDLSVPLDSYVLKYFGYMEEYLDVGVPVYFVTKTPYNFADPEAGKLICGSSGCSTYSLTQQITYASQEPDYWTIETPAASWYDDYIGWLKPQGLGGSQSCCKFNSTDPSDFCSARESPVGCEQCLSNDSYTSEQFMNYLPWFLVDNPGIECNKGGHSAYGGALSITENYKGSNRDVVEASYFMSYHSVCIKSTDCTNNLVRAREIAANITATIRAAATKENGFIVGDPNDFEVYPYCLYYVYYEQYLTIMDDTLFQIGICLIPTFVFSFILLGFDFYSGLVTIVTILMIVVDTAGFSSLWGIDLNAVSLINLVSAIGLSVEFISHVVHTFSLTTNRTRKERVIHAMSSMGPAVFAGVAMTNLPGIIVLHWATAQLIEVFFFRMCLIITLLGMGHGLIFLPVFLSYFGPPVNKALLYEKQKEMREAKDTQGFKNKAFKEENHYEVINTEKNVGRKFSTKL